MSDTSTAESGAQEVSGQGAPQNDEAQKDPFAGFESEAFVSGEPVEEKPAKPAAPAPAVQEKPAEQGTEGGDEVPGDDTGTEGGDDAGKPLDAPKKSVQERINELTRARREAERRVEALQAELNQSRSVAKPAEPAAKVADTSAAAETAQGVPNPESYDFGELDSRYIRDLARYEADQRYAELREQDRQERLQTQQQQQQQAAHAKFQTRVEEGSKKYEDFYEKVVIGAENVAWPLSPELGQLIVESDAGADIAYHLATNPDEAARIFAQSPLEQARYFGRMESKFSAAQSAAPGEDAKDETATAKTPKAPPPVTPAKGAGGRSPVSANTDDFSSFEAVAMERK